MSHLLQLLLLLSLIIAAAKLAGAAATRLGQPAVFGELLVGLVLGPTVLDVLSWPTFAGTAEGSSVSPAPLAGVVTDFADVGVILLMLVAGLETDLDQMVATITGSYLAGVLLTRTSFKKRIDEGVHPLTYSILVPVFFISIGLRANGRELGPQAAFTLSLVLVAIVGKIVGCGGLAKVCGFTRLESLRVGLGMISRGEVGLIVAGYGLSHGVIGQAVFSAAVLVVLATTMVTPPLLRLAYPGGSRHGPIAVEEAFTQIPGDVHAAALKGRDAS